jgi:Domain of unknown function (DUF4178)/S-adenosylmethionine decarboxylase
VTSGSGPATGELWTIDAAQCDPELLRDRAVLGVMFDTIVSLLGLHPVAPAIWHTFPHPGGVTGALMLGESHLTVHTFPEHRSACSPACRARTSSRCCATRCVLWCWPLNLRYSGMRVASLTLFRRYRDPPMTALETACPNCGATIRFRWVQAVQTTCAYCNSILVRTDLDWRRVGAVAELPGTSSPIQLGTTGVWDIRGFTVVGRILYRWSRGRWNEWHCIMDDGKSAWLSDAQLEYAMSELQPESTPLPSASELLLSESCRVGTDNFVVKTRTTASYDGVEGELPFEYWDKSDCSFVDLLGDRGRFATIDYSESPPLLFVGESVTYRELKLQNVVIYDGWTTPAAR